MLTAVCACLAAAFSALALPFSAALASALAIFSASLAAAFSALALAFSAAFLEASLSFSATFSASCWAVALARRMALARALECARRTIRDAFSVVATPGISSTSP